jgi:hypothetical protein
LVLACLALDCAGGVASVAIIAVARAVVVAVVVVVVLAVVFAATRHPVFFLAADTATRLAQTTALAARLWNDTAVVAVAQMVRPRALLVVIVVFVVVVVVRITLAEIVAVDQLSFFSLIAQR